MIGEEFDADELDFDAAAERYEDAAALLLKLEHMYKKRAAKQRTLSDAWADLLFAAESVKLARDLTEEFAEGLRNERQKNKTAEIA